MTDINQTVHTVGLKRFITLAIFIAINVALAGAWQKWLLPQHETLDYQKNQVETKRRQLEQENIDMPKKYIQLKANDDRFETLKAKGFTQDQDRIDARGRIDTMRATIGVRGIDYKIAPQDKATLPADITVNGTVVHSKIDVDMKGLTDLEMRNFIKEMHEKFGALVSVSSVELGVGEELTEQNLLQISRKQPVDLVKGKVSFEWYNVLPSVVDPNAMQAQAFGGNQ